MTNLATTPDIHDGDEARGWNLLAHIAPLTVDYVGATRPELEAAPSIGVWVTTVGRQILGYDVDQISVRNHPLPNALEQWSAWLDQLGMWDFDITEAILEPWIEDSREATESFGSFLTEGWPSE